jgi:hypothetical protein
MVRLIMFLMSTLIVIYLTPEWRNTTQIQHAIFYNLL